jgi:hypothetical protein
VLNYAREGGTKRYWPPDLKSGARIRSPHPRTGTPHWPSDQDPTTMVLSSEIAWEPSDWRSAVTIYCREWLSPLLTASVRWDQTAHRPSTLFPPSGGAPAVMRRRHRRRTQSSLPWPLFSEEVSATLCGGVPGADGMDTNPQWRLRRGGHSNRRKNSTETTPVRNSSHADHRFRTRRLPMLLPHLDEAPQPQNREPRRQRKERRPHHGDDPRGTPRHGWLGPSTAQVEFAVVGASLTRGRGT